IMGEKTLSAQTAYTSLVTGVEALDFSHVIPCILQLTADKAFPLLVNTAGEVLIAASQYGRGKIVVLPNEECLTTPTFFPFLQNAVNWLKPSTVSQVGVQSMFPSLAEFFTSKGHKVLLQTSFSNTFEVYCRNADEDSQSVELISFIKGGGGLLIAGQTRSWSSKNNQDVFSSYPGNKVAGVTGIHFSASFSQTGVFPFLKEIPISPFMAVNEINFLPHIESLLNDISKFRLKLSGTASELLVHGGNAFSLTQGDKLQAPMAAALYGRGRVVVMTHEQMLTVPNLKHFTRNALSWLDAGRKGDIGLTKTLLAFYNLLLSENLDMKFKLSDLTPSLSVFCCDSYHEQDVEKILEFVAEGGGLLVAGQAWYWSSVNQDKEAMADYPGSRDFAWRSTGLYLSPKTSAIFTFPASVTSAGLQVQIGCHTDNLIECNPVCRPPVVTQKLHVTKEKLTVSSLLGGLIYIYLPPKAKLGKFNVKIESAKRAPFYQKGKTDVSEWLKTIRHYPAPWAEFAAENIILTVPSDVASSVEDPEDLLRFWDDIMAAVAELAAIPNVSRPERIVADVQIAFGFMHSGYPIMINTTSAPSFVNLKKMKTEGFWGAIHELGHNQEKEAWMFRPHTNEAINNLWSVYVHEKLCNIPRHTAHHQLQPEKRKERIKTYVKEGAKLEKWAVFTALETYLQ
ncbi:hypothetical protein FKM82_020554, partial [Ascaphus truei]